MVDPWSFGWTQVLTIIGLTMTAVISFAGLRTFGKWRRESIEDRRIEVAIEALAIAYQSKYVFENIRAPMIFPYEYEDMPVEGGVADEQRGRRGEYYAVLKRIERNKEFFESVWKIQPRMMALFGRETESIFFDLHEARRNIEVSAGLLFQHFQEESYGGKSENTKRLRRRQRQDISWAEDQDDSESTVPKKLQSFRERMEALCRPVVERGYKR